MKIKTAFVAMLFCWGVSVQAAPTTPNGRKPLGINIFNNIDYSPELHFVDLMKQARLWNGTDWNAGPVTFPADSNGYPTQVPTTNNFPLVKTIMCTGLGGHYPAGTYTLVIEGHGTVTLDWDAQNKGPFQGPGTYQVPVTPSNNGVVLAITYSDVNNPITGIHFVMPGYENTYQSDPLYPAFYQPLQGMGVLRFMDAMQVNTNWLNTAARYNWSASNVVPTTFYTQDSLYGMSPEYIAMICNKVNADCWINIPAFADDYWVGTFAHRLHQTLNPNLTVYIEYSNELWNGGTFYQGSDVAAKGVVCGDPGTDYFAATHGYHARRISQVWQAFQYEWGDLSHIVRVAGAWFDNAAYGENLLNCFNNSTINPTQQRPDAIAVGAYFGYGLIATSAADLEQQTVGYISGQYTNDVVGNATIAKKHGVRLIAYEGGQHYVSISGDPTQTAIEIAANRDAGIGPLYQQMFNAWYNNGGELFDQYNYVGNYDKSGSWGAMEYLGQTSSPKWQAIQNELATLGGGGGISSPMISLNSSLLSFSGPTGANPANQTLTISNGGSGTLAWTASKTQSWLSLSSTSGGNSGSITVSVNTSGLSAGTYNDTITITDPNASNNPQMVSVSLTLTSTVAGLPVITAQPQNVTVVAGQTATFNVIATGGSSSSGGASISFAPTSLALGSSVVGTPSTSQAILVTNSGSSSLTISNIAASGDFSQTNNCGTLAAGAQCAMSVVFTPSATGSRSGTITVTDNATGSPQTITLSGTGTASGGGGGGGGGGSTTGCVIMEAPPYGGNMLTFPNTPVGGSYKYNYLQNRIYNGCTTGVTLTRSVVVGPNASDFIANDWDAHVANDVNNPYLPLGVYQSLGIEITFSPGAGGGATRTATLQVYDSAADSPTLETLVGTIGATGSLSVHVAADAGTTLTYQWQVLSNGQWVNDTTDSGATSATLTITNAQSAQSGTSYRVVVTNSVGSVTSSAAVLTVSASASAPTISVQPQSKSATAGQSATFSVTASGIPSPTYQWQVLSNGQWANDTVDSGATTSNLAVNNTQVSQSGYQYRVIVTNSAGSVTSSAATLTVTSGIGNCTPISFVAGSVSPVTVAPNAPFTMTCDYGMLMNSIVPLPGSGSCPTFTGFNGTVASFSCTAGAVGGTFANNCSVVTISPYNLCARTDSITSTIVQGANQAPSITAQPQNASVTAGQSATFNVTATGNPTPTYQWQVLSNGQWVNDTTDSGATTASLSITSPLVSQSGTSYKVVVTNSAGSVTSAIVVMTVTAPVIAPVISAQPQNVTVTAGQAATFNVTAAGSPSPTYQWQVLTNGQWANDTADSGATTASLSINNTLVSQSGTSYKVIVTNSGGSVTSSVVVLTVNPAIVLCTPDTFVSGSVSPTTVAPGGAYTMSCNYGVAANSIATVPGSGTCQFSSFAGTTAQFSCTAGSAAGTFTNSCAMVTIAPNNYCTRIDAINSLVVQVSAPVQVTVTPPTVSLNQGQTQSFAATVTGNVNTAVTWSISPNVGSINQSGVYTAPASISSLQSITITATSAADNTKSASASVSLVPPVPVQVSLTPQSVTLPPAGSQGFQATVTGSVNTAVTWSVYPQVGSVNSSGVYTAPATVAFQQIVLVTATSQADASKNASATVTLQASPAISVSVNPNGASLLAGQTQAFTATVSNSNDTAVTWTINPVLGSIDSSGLYHAPATVTNQQTVTVTATSHADATKSASVGVSLIPPSTTGVSVVVNPPIVTLSPSQSQIFAATVSGSVNTTVTWTLNPNVGSISSQGVYTAPSAIATQQVVTVTATSQADGTKFASANVLLLPASPIQVFVNPQVVSLQISGVQVFQAYVSGSSNQAVTWTLSPAVGSVSSQGVYTAPSSIASQQIVTVTATSQADGTKSATALVILMPPPPVQIVLDAQAVILQASGFHQFYAAVIGSANTGVTWSLSVNVGTLVNGFYTAPATIATQQVVTVTATSQADATKSASAQVVLLPSMLGGSTGAPPDPILFLPDVLPSNSLLQLDNINTYSAVTFTWTFTPQFSGANAGHQSNASSSSGATLSATSAVGRFSLASLNLPLGKYTITVKAASNGLTSNTISQTVTLVAATLDSVRVYPNPWRSDKSTAKKITFDNLPTQASIKIFTVSGHLAKDLGTANGSITWDMTNDSGDKVASGIYVYLIKDANGNKVRGKVAIVK